MTLIMMSESDIKYMHPEESKVVRNILHASESEISAPRSGRSLENNSSKWYDGNDKDLLSLRQCLDIYNKNDINKALFTYTKTIELITSEFPNMSVIDRQDWAIANALSPHWFDDSLTSRVQNSMLVSALLLTVAASNFLSPPGTDNTDPSFRAGGYINGICCSLFLTSIVAGICFIENAMNRAYCWSDRFSLIMKFYFLKNISQIFAAVGTIIFFFALLLGLANSYLNEDCIAFYVLFGLIGVFMIYCQFSAVQGAAALQNIRTKRLTKITDSISGRLLSIYMSPCEDLQEIGKLKISGNELESPDKVFAAMYYSEFFKYKDSTFGFVKL